MRRSFKKFITSILVASMILTPVLTAHAEEVVLTEVAEEAEEVAEVVEEAEEVTVETVETEALGATDGETKIATISYVCYPEKAAIASPSENVFTLTYRNKGNYWYTTISPAGTELTVNEGYQLDGWYKGGSRESTSPTFVPKPDATHSGRLVYSDATTYTAKFKTLVTVYNAITGATMVNAEYVSCEKPNDAIKGLVDDRATKYTIYFDEECELPLENSSIEQPTVLYALNNYYAKLMYEAYDEDGEVVPDAFSTDYEFVTKYENSKTGSLAKGATASEVYGYRFLYWGEDTEATAAYCQPKREKNYGWWVYEDATYTANYEKVDFEVGFFTDKDGAKPQTTKLVRYKDCFTEASIPEAPTKAGYTFAGWFYTSDSRDVPFNPGTEGYVITQDWKVFAKWTKNSNPSGGGSGSSTPKQAAGAVVGTWSYIPTTDTWTFADTNGTVPVNTWLYVYNQYAPSTALANTWFHFNAAGIMETGYHWYQSADGNWRLFYLHEGADGYRGRMYMNETTPDGNYTDANGFVYINGIQQVSTTAK